MTNAAELIALAERVEGASGPDWRLDEQIAEALGWYWRKETRLGLNGRTPGRMVWRKPNGAKAPLPKFTASLDAAMTLVPEEVYIKLVGPAGKTHSARLDGKRLYMGQVGIAATFPLALTAAALRAREPAA
jgi:hypothetical protein